MNKPPKDTALIKKCFYLAAARPQSPFVCPEAKKQIVIVSRNYKLLAALSELAEQENAQLRHARQGTPDVLVFSGAVKIIDRPYLGEETWETFCEYLEQVNDEAEFPLLDEQGEIIFEEPIYDETPLIIIDSDPANTRLIFLEPKHPIGCVYYIEQQSVELILHLTRKLVRGSSETGACMVKAVDGPEGERVDL